jgi:hypothetical protein
VSVAVDDPAVGLKGRSEPLDGIVAHRLDGRGDGRGEVLQHVEDDREQQLVLAAEVPVDQPDADLGFRSDRLHGHGV